MEGKPATAARQECVNCHTDVTPGIVSDWELSAHSKWEVTCSVCHGAEHMTADDFHLAGAVTAEKCIMCHQIRGDQFKAGKHSLAWSAMKAMPTIHWQPMTMTEGMKGCGGCHKIGLKSEKEVEELRAAGAGFGLASCDACHTRHTFSVAEARQPQACQTCHMGFDHPQWEMYSSSKHGVRYLLKQIGVLDEKVQAPTCQTCHMKDGNHEVRTAWGFLGVRLPMPEDPEWAEARATVLQALGLLDPDGEPTERFEAIKALDMARLTEAEWAREREQMLGVCGGCHSRNFARAELKKGDDMIREADLLMAEAIRIISGLYQEGLLDRPEGYAHFFPDLLSFYDAPSRIEQQLFVMFFKHRMRTFQGTFHANPDYALWYGWSEMRQDLRIIQDLARDMRRAGGSG